MKHLLVYFSLLIFQISCGTHFEARESENTQQNNEVLMDDQKSNYLALGDSYTIGQSVSYEDRFPVLLVQYLNEKANNYDAPVFVAKTGWTTDELDAAIQSSGITDTFDLVTLLIGVNNQYRGRDPENYRTEYIHLLEQALDFAGGKKENVVVVSIPDWGVSPFAQGKDRDKIREEIDLFNSIKKEETEKFRVSFVNITDISREALNKPEYFADDGLHFSGLMHQLWVNEIYRVHFYK